MSTPGSYREIERKYLIETQHLEHLPEALRLAPEQRIEQYYLNHPSEPYELRLRRSELGDTIHYVATIKKGTPPERLEMETPVSANTFDYWLPAAGTEVLRKTRQILQHTAGHWALDSFLDFNFKLLEAEGSVAQPTFGTDVTDDIRFTNFQMARLRSFVEGRPLTPTQEHASDLEPLHETLATLTRTTPLTIVGIAGDTASGKTTIARRLAQPYGEQALVMSQDDYYRGVSVLKQLFGDDFSVNFDEPRAFDIPMLATHLTQLKAGQPIAHPTYSMATSERTSQHVTVDPGKKTILFIEGIHALDPLLAEIYDYTLFVNAPLATRVGRRLERDLHEGRSYQPEENLRYLLEVAEPTYQPYHLAQKSIAQSVIQT